MFSLLIASFAYTSVVRSDDLSTGWSLDDHFSLLQISAQSHKTVGLRTENIVSADAPDCFETGDGTGAREQSIGNADSHASCIAMVKAQCPTANGATMVASGNGACFCEFGQTGRNNNAAYINCGNLDLDPPDDVAEDEAAACFETGDGTGVREQNIGNADSHALCIAMVKAQCPTANGATMVASGNGACFCEFGQRGRNDNAAYINCGLDLDPPDDVAQDEAADPSDDVAQDEAAACFETGDGTGAREQNIGNADSRGACIAMVKAQCPTANGATLVASGNGACFCEFGQTGRNDNAGYINCGNLDFGADANDAAIVGDPHVSATGGKTFDVKVAHLKHVH